MKRLVLAGVLALTATSSTQAHIGGAEGLVPFLDDDGAVIGAGTTWGLVFASDGAYAQTCEEAIGDTPTAFIRVDDGARTITAMGLGVVESDDDGCSWTTVPGTAGRAVSALQSSATTTGTIWASTATVGGIDNAVMVSTDHGRSFASANTVAATILLTSLAVGDVAGADVVVVGGVDTTTRAPLLRLLTTTAATTLTTLPVPGDSQLAIALTIEAGTTDEDRDLWFSTLDRIGRGHLWRAAIGANGDVDSAAAVEVGAFDGLVTATATHAGFRFVLAAGGILFRAPLISVVDTATVWQRVPQPPLRCLQHVDNDQGVWACGAASTGAWFVRSVDGESWAPVLPFSQVIDHRCPSTTPAAAACAYRFEVPTPPPDETPPEVKTRPAETTSSCGGGGGGSAAMFGLLVLRRRRRLRC